MSSFIKFERELHMFRFEILNRHQRYILQMCCNVPRIITFSHYAYYFVELAFISYSNMSLYACLFV